MRIIKRNTLGKKLLTAVAAGALFLGTFTPALAVTNLEITGNGSDSENQEEVTKTNNVTVVQSNTAEVTNSISAEVSTGDNEANDNTGGWVTIETGSATANTNISNTLNANIAEVKNCGECVDDIQAEIADNGSHSENEIEVQSSSCVSLFQENLAEVENGVEAEVESGDNEANGNTDGDVIIMTGPATANTNIESTANANIAEVEGGDQESLIEASVTGNGADSENQIDLNLNRLVTMVQENAAWIANFVDVDALSGENEANDNTNGMVAIGTSPATANTNINNTANFNFAHADCCFENEEDEIDGNGAESENEIEKEILNGLFVFQNGQDEETNSDHLWSGLAFHTYVSAEPSTGDNETKENTDPDHVDPFILTAPATANTNVNNTGGLNIFDPDGNGWVPQVDFGFDFGEIWNLIH